jgi:hypothetical protein
LTQLFSGYSAAASFGCYWSIFNTALPGFSCPSLLLCWISTWPVKSMVKEGGLL